MNQTNRKTRAMLLADGRLITYHENGYNVKTVVGTSSFNSFSVTDVQYRELGLTHWRNQALEDLGADTEDVVLKITGRITLF
jgi:hypothetical protein